MSTPAPSETPRLSFLEPDIALITFDDPKKGANVLSSSVLERLNQLLDELQQRPDVKGLVIRSGKRGAFLAGADLREFLVSLDAPKSQIAELCRHARRIFQRLSTLPFVTVAAIDGVCLGGGAELSIWCDHRIMTDEPKSQFGFPEVKLGLYPGWGGTARASRIVGLGNAVELVTGGEPIGARAALAMGLIIDIAAPDRLNHAAIALIRSDHQSGKYLAARARLRQPLQITETELAFLGATASAVIQQQTKGHYPAPVAALELMLEAASLDVDAACEKEAQGMAELFGSPVNKALINVFFLGDRNKKDAGVDTPNIKPRPIKAVAIIGAGIMGRGIAAANLRRDHQVTMTDAAPAALSGAVESVLADPAYDKQLKGPDPKRAVQIASLLRSAPPDADFSSGADLVIEAVVEEPGVKKSIFGRLEPKLRPETILASNTSTIPITQMAQGMTRPERFCGIHFFNPVRKMPLVEVIRGAATSDETVATAVAYAKSLGKSPIVVKDGPGFLVNRLLLFYLAESLELLIEGVDMRDIDRAGRKFGMPLGPLGVYDLVGLDTAVHAGRVMYEAFPNRVPLSPVITALCRVGRLGQKSGAGFYSYAKNKERGDYDPQALEILKPYIRERKADQKLSADDLAMRLVLPMLTEATRLLEERLVRDPRDIDLGIIYGIGFPPFRGGILFWADTMGLDKIVPRLEALAPLGKRFEPTPLLREMAASGKRFY